MIPLIYIFIRRASDQPFIHFLIIVILTIGKRGGKQRRVTGHTSPGGIRSLPVRRHFGLKTDYLTSSGLSNI